MRSDLPMLRSARSFLLAGQFGVVSTVIVVSSSDEGLYLSAVSLVCPMSLDDTHSLRYVSRLEVTPFRVCPLVRGKLHHRKRRRLSVECQNRCSNPSHNIAVAVRNA